MSNILGYLWHLIFPPVPLCNERQWRVDEREGTYRQLHAAMTVR